MSHCLPLPISARKGSGWLRVCNLWLGNLPEPETKPARWPFLFLPAAPQILLHPRAQMASPASARTDSGPGCAATWKSSSAGSVLIQQVCDRFVLDDARTLQSPPHLWPPRCAGKEAALHPGEPRSTFKEIMLKTQGIGETLRTGRKKL